MISEIDVLVIGGGQAGLATGYFLKRAKVAFEILDAEEGPGGAWRHGWQSLRLFSPAQWSSLPGWPMPQPDGGLYPKRDHVLEYLIAYEARYELPIIRPVRVTSVTAAGDALEVAADDGRRWRARAVVSATGTWRKPFIPDVPGRQTFTGVQIHSAHYGTPEAFARKRVAIVGGGNSAAQILAEVSQVAADTLWVTLEPPSFLPDDVDGRVLFERASAKLQAVKEGRDASSIPSLGDIVMVEPVRQARERGVLAQTARPFRRMTATGAVLPGGREISLDAVIWCTGFRPALDHLVPLGVVEPDGKIAVVGSRSVKESRLWCVGYGEWTGFGSATLVGVTRATREASREIADMLGRTALNSAAVQP